MMLEVVVVEVEEEEATEEEKAYWTRKLKMKCLTQPCSKKAKLYQE
jgi:hypothetical protein